MTSSSPNTMASGVLALLILTGLAAGASAEAPLSGIECTLRCRDANELPLGSSLALVLEIINATDQPVVVVGSFPAVRFQVLSLRRPQGDVAVATQGDVGTKEKGHALAPRTALVVPVFLGTYFQGLGPGPVTLNWRLGLRLAQSPDEGVYTGTLALQVVPRDQPAAAARVQELTIRYREIYDITGGRSFDRREIVEEICATDDVSVVPALRAILSTPVGASESGRRIVRALGDRWAEPTSREVINETLEGNDSGIAGEALAQYVRYNVFAGQQTLVRMLESSNPGIGWQALSYQQRILRSISQEQFNVALTLGWVPVEKIHVLAQGNSTLSKPAQELMALLENRKQGRPTDAAPVEPEPVAVPAKDGAGF